MKIFFIVVTTAMVTALVGCTGVDSWAAKRAGMVLLDRRETRENPWGPPGQTGREHMEPAAAAGVFFMDPQWALLANNKNGRFRGMVVDQEGRPLKDVTVEVYCTRVSGVMLTDSVVEQYRLPEGAFDVRVSVLSSFGLRFAKEGYYSEEIHSNDDKVREEAAKEYEKPDGQLKIPLVKKGKITRLKEYNLTLAFSADGKAAVVDAAQLDGKGNAVTRPAALEKNDGAWMLPAGVVGVAAATDESGRIALKSPRSYHPGPLGVRLIAAGEGNGFVRTTIKPDKAYLAQMRQAPETGYVPELVEATASSHETSDERYFFCRINGRYGRGLVVSRELSKDEMTLKVRLRLEMQPDGTRNLETGQ